MQFLGVSEKFLVGSFRSGPLHNGRNPGGRYILHLFQELNFPMPVGGNENQRFNQYDTEKNPENDALGKPGHRD